MWSLSPSNLPGRTTMQGEIMYLSAWIDFSSIMIFYMVWIEFGLALAPMGFLTIVQYFIVRIILLQSLIFI
jgi:hypothetical protein